MGDAINIMLAAAAYNFKRAFIALLKLYYFAILGENFSKKIRLLK